jgi:hypothetical protein
MFSVVTYEQLGPRLERCLIHIFFYGEVIPIAERVVFSLIVLPTELHCRFHGNFTHVILSIVLDQTADSILATL